MDFHEFFRALYGAHHDHRHVILFALPSKQAWGLDGAWSVMTPEHVYFHVGTSAKVKRLRESDVTAIPGLWADIDVAGKDSAKKYPPLEQVDPLLEELGLRPTIVVHTGGGLQAYWLFPEPWVLSGDEERAACKTLSQQWGATLASVWGRHGYAIDSTHDLARILRVPDTTNHKYPAKVYVEHHDLTRRYEPDAFRMVAVRPAMVADHAPTIPTRAYRPSKGVPTHAIQLAMHDSRFRRVWERKASLKDESASGYDMAIANAGVYHGWSDQEIGDAMSLWRQIHGQNPDKLTEHPSYVARTIGNARANRDEDEKEQESQEAVNEAKRHPPTTPTDTLAAISKILGLRVVRFVRHRVDPPMYHLVIVGARDQQQEIPLGTSNGVLTLGLAKRALFDAGVVLAATRRNWAQVVKMLATVAVDADEPPDDTVLRFLGEYLATSRNSSDPLRSEPFTKGNELFIHAEHYHQWISRYKETKVGKYTLLKLIRQGGWEVRVVNVAGGTRNYRRKAIDDLPEDVRDVISVIQEGKI